MTKRLDELAEEWLMKHFGAQTPEGLDFIASDTHAVNDSRIAFKAGYSDAVKDAIDLSQQHKCIASFQCCIERLSELNKSLKGLVK